MNIPDLMLEIVALWPQHWGSQAEIDAAARSYRAVLFYAQGERLQTGWERTVGEWRKAKPPLPADIASHVPAEARDADETTRLPDPWQWAKTVMRMPEGQDALRRGCGNDAWLWAERHPGQILPREYVDECAAAGERVRAMMASGESLGACDRALRGAWEAMQERERELREEFLRVEMVGSGAL